MKSLEDCMYELEYMNHYEMTRKEIILYDTLFAISKELLELRERLND